MTARRLPVLAAALAAVLVAVAAAAGVAAPEPTAWTVRAPGSALAATIARSGASALSLTVRRGGRVVLTTPLGRSPTTSVRATEAAVDDRFATPAGKRRRHELRARRLTLRFGPGREVQVLAAADGVAFRQVGAGRETTAWRPPAGTRSWLQDYRPDYEGSYRPGLLTAAAPGDYGFPALLDTGQGTWALLTESGLAPGDPAARLSVARRRPGVLRVALPPGSAPERATPWRVAIVGDLGTVVGSDLPLDLGRPSQIADTRWIHPGRVAWSWWSDPDSPGNVVRQRQFIRRAARSGWEYVLLDEGWKPADVPGLVRFAARRHVRVLLWTDWHALADPVVRARTLSRWAGWGVAGVKADFLLSDTAGRMAVYDAIARDAAARHLVVDFHGCTIPRGIQRTWPNVLTMEAVRGAERETPGQGSRAMDPAQDVDLAFTRNVVGSMDYTPVTFSAPNRLSTAAHRLAQAVVYESGLQHLADTPESYERHPLALPVLRDLPVAWDDTRLLDGTPDASVTIARRAGAQWWVGSLAAGPAHTQTLALSAFLHPRRRYRLHLVRDDGSGGLAAEDRIVTRADRLAIPVDRNGGFTAEFTPAA
jgi:alpha-glucosidase